MVLSTTAGTILGVLAQAHTAMKVLRQLWSRPTPICLDTLPSCMSSPKPIWYVILDRCWVACCGSSGAGACLFAWHPAIIHELAKAYLVRHHESTTRVAFLPKMCPLSCEQATGRVDAIEPLLLNTRAIQLPYSCGFSPRDVPFHVSRPWAALIRGAPSLQEGACVVLQGFVFTNSLPLAVACR
eukprot:92687-Pelagomonas_calceolata.AAC.1